MALLFGVAFLLLFGLAEHYQTFGARVTPLVRRQIVGTQFLVGLYALNFLVLAMTVLTSVDTLSGEISSGTIQAVATKPIRRGAILVGQGAGFFFLLAGLFSLFVGGPAPESYRVSRPPTPL